MLHAIGETLPLAIAIAFSPLAIVAVVVMLLSDRPRASSLGFLAGWAIGVGVVASVGYLLSRLLPAGEGGGGPATPLVLLVLGVVCLGLAVQQWRSRPGADDDVAAPRWMARITGMTWLTSLAFGAIFGGIKPKNLVLAFGSGVAIEAAGVEGVETVVTLGIFILIASLSIGAPVVAFLIAGDRMRAPLDRLREWMVRHNSAMMGVILLLVGMLLIGKALGAL